VQRCAALAQEKIRIRPYKEPARERIQCLRMNSYVSARDRFQKSIHLLPATNGTTGLIPDICDFGWCGRAGCTGGREEVLLHLSGYLTPLRRVLPALNEGAVEAVMAMLSPVRRLRPVRAGRDRVEKAPKLSATVTVSPLESASPMVENTALTAASASDLDSEVLAATWAASSRLIILVVSWKSARSSVSWHGWSSDGTSTKRPLGGFEGGVHARLGRKRREQRRNAVYKVTNLSTRSVSVRKI